MTRDPVTRGIEILDWPAASRIPGVVDQVEAIFFAASATQDFASPAIREAFRERWLGRYQAHCAESVHVAVDCADRVAGYLAGCRAHACLSWIFEEQPQWALFRAHIRNCPAHVHVNVHPAVRGRGIGVRLISAFDAHCVREGVPAYHAVTARGARNVGFYESCGFAERAAAETAAGQTLILLERTSGEPAG